MSIKVTDVIVLKSLSLLLHYESVTNAVLTPYWYKNGTLSFKLPHFLAGHKNLTECAGGGELPCTE